MKKLLDLIIHFRFKVLFVESTTNNYVQMFRFAILSSLATVVDWLVLVILTALGFYYLLSNAISFTCGIITSFFMSRKKVFNANNSNASLSEFIVYVLISIVGMGIFLFSVFVLTEKIGINHFISRIIATPLVFAWNYLSRKYFLYKFIK